MKIITKNDRNTKSLWYIDEKGQKCNECSQYVSIAIELGFPPVIDRMGSWLCLDCLEKAVKLIKGN